MVRALFFLGVIAVCGAGGYYAFAPEGLNGKAFVLSLLGDEAEIQEASTEPSEQANTGPSVTEQRIELAAATDGQGFGPQSPRDLNDKSGANPVSFATAPDAAQMNLCNIHFHKNAEHRGGNFTTYAGDGNGKGYGTGFKYDGALTSAELAPVAEKIGAHEYGALEPGDTIEIHFVHSTAQVRPGPTLGACLNEKSANPHLRVETVVAVLVNDPGAADFQAMASFTEVDGFIQAPNIPRNLGSPIAYLGSTTGPSFNTKGSPFQVSWSVRPEVIKMDITSVGAWLKDNPFDEKYAHGVRNLVENEKLISPIQ